MGSELTRVSRVSLERAVVAALNARPTASVWGQSDCALWCADVLRGPLGFDPAESYRGRYGSPEQARSIMGKKGLIGVVISVARKRGWRQIKSSVAEVGDVGIAVLNSGTDGRRTQSLMICRRQGWFVGKTSCGFAVLSADVVSRAWSVA